MHQLRYDFVTSLEDLTHYAGFDGGTQHKHVVEWVWAAWIHGARRSEGTQLVVVEEAYKVGSLLTPIIRYRPRVR